MDSSQPNQFPRLPAAVSIAPSTTQQTHDMMDAFWENQTNQILHDPIDFKSHTLPLARIKRVMKSDEQVKQMMISSEAPILFSKACEMFILELTLRSWIQTEECKRRTLQKSDVCNAVGTSDVYDCNTL